MQQRDGALISQGIGRENIQTLEPNVNGRTHKCLIYPFLLLCPIIYFFQKLVEVVNALGMEEYGSQIRIGKTHNLWKMIFFLMGQFITQKLVLKTLFTHVLLFLTQLEQGGNFLHVFLLFSFIHPWMGTCFCNAKWLG